MAEKQLFISNSEAETETLGRRLAQELKPGDVLALSGDLGAGKTCLVRGLAQGLAASELVTSPTFTLINEYHGRMPIYHFDLYRLRQPRELEDLGCDEYFFNGGVCVVEWAEKAGHLLPTRHWRIDFHIQAGNQRRVEITPPEAGKQP